VIQRTPRVVRRESLGPIEADEPHRVVKPAPPPPAPSVPVLDALTLLYSWRRARMNGDRTNAAALLAELERLAERPKRRTEGEHDEQYG
jgi:hypothetical protein